MRKILLIILLGTFFINVNNLQAKEKVNNKIELDTLKCDKKLKDAKEWNILIKAIIQCESRGIVNAKSKDGKSCGIMQITPICVKECNNILGYQKYTLNDRFNKEKSLEMFEIIQNRHNSKRSIERAIRLWNGGPTYSTHKTNGYYRKVITIFNSLKNEEDKN